MAIASRDALIAAMAGRQDLRYCKTTSRTSVAATWFSVFDESGNPGAGTLAGTSTAAGVVPTGATAGCNPINAFGGSNTGYVDKVEFGSTVACRVAVFDLLWKGGAYAFNAAVTLSGQPSYSGRVPNADYTGTQVWLETVTAFTGNQSIAVTYTNSAGTGGQSTGTVATGVAPTVGRLLQLPLAAGDVGVQLISTVTSTVSTVGTFNVLVLRPLWTGRVKIANDGDVHGPDKTGLPVVFASSAIYVAVSADSTATGVPELNIGVING